MKDDHDEFGLMQCPQPFQWTDDDGNECRGVMTWARGEMHAITRQSRSNPARSEYLMATACSRKLVWVEQDELTPIPFRRD